MLLLLVSVRHPNDEDRGGSDIVVDADADGNSDSDVG